MRLPNVSLWVLRGTVRAICHRVTRAGVCGTSITVMKVVENPTADLMARLMGCPTTYPME